ncbi:MULTISPECIES: YihY/virulence factor BrkB family protein [Actinomycetes]|uniref:YihY/virulence factor BrkB family protein n=1 Tax=Actinomycetes TaxID=1760 RepID=UPI0009E096B2|nr:MULTISPECIES: YihY/virulence factor BrkB family protein [Actinomycetes]
MLDTIATPTEPEPEPAPKMSARGDDASCDEAVPRRPPVLKTIPRLLWRTITKSWDDSIFAMSAQAAFWQTLSLPPLLLGILGSLGYIGGWFGPNTDQIISDGIIDFAERTFSQNVVDEIITPTVDNVLVRGRAEVISVGFLLSLWAGSSAMSSFVDSIVVSHGQHNVRHAVTQRLFALWLYVCFLVLSVFTLPLVALGPTYVREVIPDSWRATGTQVIDYGYFPAVAVLVVIGLTTLYRVALANPLPWHRLLYGALLAGVVFWVASAVLRWYLSIITKTGYSYGALATPIAFLLFTFFLGFSIVIGAEFNAIVQETWPAKSSKIDQVRDWVSEQTSDITDQLKMPNWLPSGPDRRPETGGGSPDGIDSDSTSNPEHGSSQNPAPRDQ